MYPSYDLNGKIVVIIGAGQGLAKALAHAGDLASPAANMFTGTTLMVDGGWTAQ